MSKKIFSSSSKLFKNKKIVLAPSSGVNYNKENIKKILKILNHPEALVTDWSTISDFFSFNMPRKKKIERLNELSKRFGFQVKMKDYLIEIAHKMRKLERTNSLV